MPKKKKIPQRMCVGCQQMRPKKEMVRIVRTPEENIEIDLKGKRSGRGAYICPSEECLVEAKKGKRLERALKSFIPEDVYEVLLKELKGKQ